MSSRSKGSASFIYIVVIIGALLIMNNMVKRVREYTTPAPLGAERAVERQQAADELSASSQAALTTYGWQDKSKEIVRLPIDRAMEITIEEWDDPAAARAKLISMSDKAVAEPPPAPEVPSEFE